MINGIASKRVRLFAEDFYEKWTRFINSPYWIRPVLNSDSEILSRWMPESIDFLFFSLKSVQEHTEENESWLLA